MAETCVWLFSHCRRQPELVVFWLLGHMMGLTDLTCQKRLKTHPLRLFGQLRPNLIDFEASIELAELIFVWMACGPVGDTHLELADKWLHL